MYETTREETPGPTNGCDWFSLADPTARDLVRRADQADPRPPRLTESEHPSDHSVETTKDHPLARHLVAMSRAA